MNKQKRFAIFTLGCRTNQYESQGYHDQLSAMGYVPVTEGEVADICIINTCTVTESADSHSRHAIRQLVRDHPGAEVLVTGCMVESQPALVSSIPGVSRVIPNQNKDQLVAELFPEEEVPEFSIKNFDAHTRAFVKVQDGCNSFCTYCVIPYVRGRSRSRTIPEVVQEVETLIANGYKEVVLTGINVGDFDGGVGVEMNIDPTEQKVRLVDLIKAVDRLPGLERLRVSSIDPDEVDKDLADAILFGKKTCHSMHIVLQSGSNVILKRMNRKYTRQIFVETVERLRAASPDFTFTTDIIVGFPGETDCDFAETLDVMRQVKFAKVHMFPYSDRPRTRAAQYPNKVPKAIIKERKTGVLRVAEQMAYELRQQFIGRSMTVLTENTDASHPGMMSGHTANFLTVWIPSIDIGSNELVDVELIENTPTGLIGRILHQQQEK